MKTHSLLVYLAVLLISPGIPRISSSTTCSRPLALTGSESEIVAQLTDPCRYDRLARPNHPQKTVVYIHIHAYSISFVDAQNLRFSTQILLRYRWNDSRLRQNRFIEHGSQLIDKIWTPHTYIVNEQESKVLGSARKDVMNTIRPDGTVVLLSRLKVTLQCLMKLQKFPFDSQRCPLIIESWSYNASQLELVWEPFDPVTIDDGLKLPEYSLVDVIVNTSKTQYKSSNEGIYDFSTVYYGKAAGNFSALTVYFALKRQYGFYIMDYYVPSILIVVVSWVSFWLDANSTPGRVVLGTSTLLTFITLSRNIGYSLPKVSYIKSSEIWFLGCTGFIFASLAEFAFVNIIWRRKNNVTVTKVTSSHILQSALTPQMYRKHHPQTLPQSRSFPSLSTINDSQYKSQFNHKDLGQLKLSLDYICSNPYPPFHQDDVTFSLPNLQDGRRASSKSVFTMTPQEVADWIDRRSRVFFPIAFVIFNCFYWSWTFLF